MRILAVDPGGEWGDLSAALTARGHEVERVPDAGSALLALQTSNVEACLLPADKARIEAFSGLLAAMRRAAPAAVVALVGEAARATLPRIGVDGAVPARAEAAEALRRLNRWLAKRRQRLEHREGERRILVVDPDDRHHEATKLLLASGYGVVGARTIEAALEHVDDIPIHVAVVDERAEPDGVVAAIRRLEPRVEVIVASCGREPDALAALARIGTTELLVGPVPAHVLLAAVHRAWGRWASLNRRGRALADGMLDALPFGVAALGAAGLPPLLNHLGRSILGVGPNDDTTRVAAQLGFDPRERCCGESGPASETREYHGKRYLVESRCVHAHGRHRGTLVLLRDASDEQRLEEHKTEFASIVSHELRTPLTTIKNALDLLGDDPALEPAARARMLAIARRNSERMMVMVRNLLDLSRIEAGHRALELSRTSLTASARAVVEAHEATARERRVRLVLEAAAEGDWVYVDTLALEQALSNLVSNAVKYTREGTTVTLRLRRREPAGSLEGLDARAAMLGSFAHEWVSVAVQDEGFGIPVPEQRRIFDKFVRIDRRAYGKSSGTGLGLSIAEGLVRSHGGSIKLRSTVGEGACFELSLPVFDRHGALAASLADRVSAAKQGHFSLGIVVLRLVRADGWPMHVDDALGERVVEAAHEALYRSRDFVIFIPSHDELVLLLEGCAPEALPRARARVATQILAVLEAAVGTGAVRLAYANGFSPPDGSLEQAVALLATAREHAQQRASLGEQWKPQDDATSWRPDEGPTSWLAGDDPASWGAPRSSSPPG